MEKTLKKKPSVTDRFMRYAMPEPNSGCWIWTSYLHPHGYGRLFVNGKSTPAHRLSWTLFVGPIPEGMGVLHKCDNRACANPDHLFLGTPADNVTDMIAKGRHVVSRGERQGSAKLSNADVIAILADDRPFVTLAREYGVHRTTIGEIKRRTEWRWITAAASPLTPGTSS